jgi:ATP-dependent Clp protease ATP-binding subunit ClpA
LFERFTERARQVVVLAQDEARALKHNYIGTEHILLALLELEDGDGVLTNLGVDKPSTEAHLTAALDQARRDR